MATKKKNPCVGFFASHRFPKKSRIVKPGIYQKTCTRCGRVKNYKCGTFWNPHRFKKDRRSKNKLTCKMCSQKKITK